MTDRDEARSKACLAVQEAMRPEDRERFLSWVLERNPQFQGADVADVLDIYHDADACLAWTEPFYEKHGPRLDSTLGIERETGEGSDYYLRAYALSYATLACAVLMEGEPLPQDVIDLAQRALVNLLSEHGADVPTACPPDVGSKLPILPSGVYRHYKGPLYQVFGYGHDANAADLYTVTRTETRPDDLVGSYTHVDVEALGERAVVVYMALQLDGAHTGPRLAVRTAADFLALVCNTAHCAGYGQAIADTPMAKCGECGVRPIRRFAYVGPEWTG